MKIWRSSARACLARDLNPQEIAWDAAGRASLIFGAPIQGFADKASTHTVPGRFLAMAALVACHRDPDRWSLLYTLLWRVTHGERHALEIASDPLVYRLTRMHRAVRRASHKMKAFVRFKSVTDSDGADEEFVAWFEPAHRVVELTAPFFVDRFRSMRWSILTPDGCARWDRESLSLSPGIERHAANVGEDNLENLWRTYYAGIFNPARLNREAMLAEMPQQYWRNLPEARLIRELAREAPRRVTTMIEQTLRAPEPLRTRGGSSS
ncbi:MAG TPA: TIGR03915 family putative DNA repair protein [Gemmatimonadaceae bacterium]|nr:TIGR03915 family putative DNA repair protein [Gemmatimonadaceae bacterium]